MEFIPQNGNFLVKHSEFVFDNGDIGQMSDVHFALANQHGDQNISLVGISPDQAV